MPKFHLELYENVSVKVILEEKALGCKKKKGTRLSF